jgi:hypothetical protein
MKCEHEIVDCKNGICICRSCGETVQTGVSIGSDGE